MAQIPDNIPAGAFMGMWNSYHQNGYHYIVGGSESILDVMSSYITENGGTIKLSTRVESLTVEDGRISSATTSDGGCYEAEHFVSNASIPSTYLNLIGDEHLPNDIIQRIKSAPAAASDITIYLGVTKDYRDHFSGGNHEIWVIENYDTSAEYWAENKCDPDRIPMVLSNHSIFDSGVAPEGKNAITISAQLEYDCHDNWSWDESYDEHQEYRDRVAKVFIERAERVLPELSAHVEVMDISSPHTLERFTLSPGGSWAGYETQADDDVSWDQEESHRSHFPNLFFAGSWASGGGIGTVIDSGRLAARLILAE